MNYPFSPQIRRRIHELMAVGRCATVDELLSQALDSVEQREEDWAAIGQGLADMEAGRMEPLDVVVARIKAKYDSDG